MIFRYYGFETDGKYVTGYTNAPEVQMNNILITSLKIVTPKPPTKIKDQIDLFTHIRTLSTTENTIVEIMQTLIGINTKHTPWLIQIYEEIKRGSLFSKSVQRFSHNFDEIILTIWDLGETTGNIKNSCDIILNHLNKKQKLINIIKGTSRYPAIIFFLLVIFMGYFIFYVLEDMASINPNIKNGMLWWIRINITKLFFSSFLSLTFICFVCKRYYFIKEWVLIRIPVIRKVIIHKSLTEIFLHLSFLEKGKIKGLEALRKVHEIVKYQFMKNSIEDTMNQIKYGKPFFKAFCEIKYLSEEHIAILRTTHSVTESDSYNNILDKLMSDYENTIKALNDCLQPILLSIVGFMTLFLYYTIMYSLYEII